MRARLLAVAAGVLAAAGCGTLDGVGGCPCCEPPPPVRADRPVQLPVDPPPRLLPGSAAGAYGGTG